MNTQEYRKPDANLSDPQIEAIERILNWFDCHIGNISNHTVDRRVWAGLLRHGIITYDHQAGNVTITPFGIQSYCATVVTKYTGATHERIHSSLNNYQRLFNGTGGTIATM